MFKNIEKLKAGDHGRDFVRQAFQFGLCLGVRVLGHADAHACGCLVGLALDDFGFQHRHLVGPEGLLDAVEHDRVRAGAGQDDGGPELAAVGFFGVAEHAEVFEEVLYQKPKAIFEKLESIEVEISKGLKELKELI